MGPGDFHTKLYCVLVTIRQNLYDMLEIARSLALFPEFWRDLDQ